jgi:hypothetical protein
MSSQDPNKTLSYWFIIKNTSIDIIIYITAKVQDHRSKLTFRVKFN